MEWVPQVPLHVHRGARRSNPRAASMEWVAVVQEVALGAGQRMAAFWRDWGRIAPLRSGESAIRRREGGKEWVQMNLVLSIGGAAGHSLRYRGRTTESRRGGIKDRHSRRAAEAERRVSLKLSRRYGLHGRGGSGLGRGIEKNVIGDGRRVGVGVGDSEVGGI